MNVCPNLKGHFMLRKEEVQAQHPSMAPVLSWQVIEHLKCENPELFAPASNDHDGFLSLTASHLPKIDTHSIHAQEIEKFFSPGGLFEEIINDLESYGQVNATLFMTHKRIGAFECAAQRMVPHKGYRIVSVTYWPQTEKGFASGSYKKVKTNCYQIDMRVHDNGTIENIQSKHFIALSKNSPLFSPSPQNRMLEAEFPSLTTRTQHICSKEDGWSQKTKISKKNISKSIFIAQWLGEPLLEHMNLARHHIGQLMEHIILAANTNIILKQFPYDLKGMNIVVARSKDGFMFRQIDCATFAVTPARFPSSEANLDKLKYQMNLAVWVNSLTDKIERDPWCVFTSNFIFLIFELYDWNHRETAKILERLAEHIIFTQPKHADGKPGVWPADFCKHFRKKAQSFLRDAAGSQMEWRKAIPRQTFAMSSSIQQTHPPTTTIPPQMIPKHTPHVPAIPSFLTKPLENEKQLSFPESTVLPFTPALTDSSIIILDDVESTDSNGYFEQATAYLPKIKRLFGF